MVGAARRYGVYLGDLRRTQNRSHGIVNYAVGLTNALPAHLEQGESLSVLASDEIRAELFPEGLPDRIQVTERPTPRHPAARLAADHVSAARWARTSRLSLVHFPKGFLPAIPPKCATVATVHDDIPLQGADAGPGLGERARTRYFRWALRHSLRRADAVVTVSSYSRSRLVGHIPREVEVIPNGLAVSHASIRPLAERPPRLLHLGSPLPHKRSAEAVSWLLEALEQSPGLELVVTGELAPSVEATVAGHPRVTRIRRPLAQAELTGLMADARALVFSSSIEGFGLPPLEAFAAGTPAAWSRHTASDETMEGFPGGYSVGDHDEFAAALDAALSSSHAELLRLSRRARDRFSWDTVAKQVLACYRRVLSGSAAGPGPSP